MQDGACSREGEEVRDGINIEKKGIDLCMHVVFMRGGGIAQLLERISKKVTLNANYSRNFFVQGKV